MAIVRFKQVSVNQEFKHNNKRWVKVKPVMKSCCKMKLNARSAIDPKVTKVFNPNVEVEV